MIQDSCTPAPATPPVPFSARRAMDQRVLVLAPTPGEARMCQGLLRGEGIRTAICAELPQATRELLDGAAALLLIEGALVPEQMGDLRAALAHQPAWSDLPVLVLTRGGSESPLAARAMRYLDNVLLLEQPVQRLTLLSAVRAAIRARQRQYQVRDYLEERQRAAEELRRTRDEAQHRAEEARQREQILAAMMEHVPMGITIADAPDVNIRAVSRYGRELTGQKREQLEDIPVQLHAQRWHIMRKDGLTPATNEELPLTRATQKGELVRGEEFVIVRPDGTRVPVLCTAAPIRDAQGNITGGVIGWQDITRLKQTEEALQQGNAKLRSALEQLQLAEETAVTQSRALQEAQILLETERQRYQDLFEAAPDAYIVTDPEGAIAEANHAALSMLGVTPQQARQTPLLLFVEPQQREVFVSAALKLRHNERLAPFELRLGPRLGPKIDVEISAAPEKLSVDEPGPRVRWLIRDITSRKRAQQALRESEQRFRTLADAMPQLAWTAHADGYIFWYNRRWYEYTGATPAQMEGWGWQAVHDPAMLPRVMERWQGSIATGEPFDMEFPLRGADGRFRWFLSRVVPLKDARGQVVQWFGTNTDVTEQRRAQAAQQRLAAIVESSEDAIVGKTLDGIITDWNPAAERLYGYTAAEAIGKPISLLIPPDEPIQWPHVVERLRRGEPMGHYESTRIGKDGQRILLSITASPVRSADGRIVGASAIARDMTQRKQMEDALRAARDAAEAAKAEAERANAAKDQFLAVLSHELRTPLTPILAAAGMLEADAVDEESREALEMIRRNAELEARLIDDLLDVTRIARGKLKLNRQPVQVCTILQRAVEVCRPDIEARRLQFGTEIINGPHVVKADPARVQQVFWNLAKNAIKFTPVGGHIGARCWQENGAVIVEFKDSGVGIEPQSLDRIFNAFEQGARSTTRKFGGLGLGLAISKAIVEMHGGKITAFSEGKDRGATFTVRLPAYAPARPARLDERRARSRQTAPSTASGGLRILLVEDHADTARIMARLLKADGYQVQTAGDVATALEQARTNTFDLLISDLGLPDGSGIDLLEQLRAAGHRFPAIAMTGYGQEDDLARTRAAGFVRHVVKPIDLDQLMRAVTEATAEA